MSWWCLLGANCFCSVKICLILVDCLSLGICPVCTFTFLPCRRKLEQSIGLKLFHSGRAKRGNFRIGFLQFLNNTKFTSIGLKGTAGSYHPPVCIVFFMLFWLVKFQTSDGTAKQMRHRGSIGGHEITFEPALFVCGHLQKRSKNCLIHCSTILIYLSAPTLLGFQTVVTDVFIVPFLLLALRVLSCFLLFSSASFFLFYLFHCYFIAISLLFHTISIPFYPFLSKFLCLWVVLGSRPSCPGWSRLGPRLRPMQKPSLAATCSPWPSPGTTPRRSPQNAPIQQYQVPGDGTRWMKCLRLLEIAWD